MMPESQGDHVQTSADLGAGVAARCARGLLEVERAAVAADTERVLLAIALSKRLCSLCL